MVYNLPNILTISRLGLAAVFFVLLAEKSWLALPLVLLAGLTDILDGYLARSRSQQTDFGRVADPVIDKILICGGFIMLLPYPLENVLQSWMVVVIVGRELAVTSLRGYAESRGSQFGATFWGKSKMLLQFVTLVFLIAIDYWPPGHSGWATDDHARLAAEVLVWATVIVTFASGLVYLFELPKFLAKKSDA